MLCSLLLHIFEFFIIILMNYFHDDQHLTKVSLNLTPIEAIREIFSLMKLAMVYPSV